MAATTHDLQRLLEDAWDHAPADGDTLREELRRNERAVGALLQHGSLASVSKNSASQSYAFGSGNTLTTADVARAWRDLINLFDGARAALVSNGTTSPTDEQVYAEMLDRCQPVYGASLDLSALRCCA